MRFGKIILYFAALFCISSTSISSEEILVNKTFKAAKAKSRPYFVEMDEKFEKDLKIVQYIVTTMANKSLAKIWKERNALKKAGDKIDHLHPFHFLLAIFTHEESKAAMASLKGREWVWGEFKKGLYTTLTEENEKRNLKVEYIKDFAKQVGIQPNLIMPAIKNCDWDELVTTLIKHVPREGDPTRYNM